jgi:hypothetical protein
MAAGPRPGDVAHFAINTGDVAAGAMQHAEAGGPAQ